jgi:DNA-directed RNA polymerase subunit M/transcription elongation factor TFIIS
MSKENNNKIVMGGISLGAEFCKKCGGLISGIYSGSVDFCRCSKRKYSKEELQQALENKEREVKEEVIKTIEKVWENTNYISRGQKEALINQLKQ